MTSLFEGQLPVAAAANVMSCCTMGAIPCHLVETNGNSPCVYTM